MKCPGMDPKNWTPADITEYACPSCSAPVEIWKDDVWVTCSGCGRQVCNPRLNDVCLSWCENASKCTGSGDIDKWKKAKDKKLSAEMNQKRGDNSGIR